MAEELRKSLQTLSSNALINILKNDYEIFGADTNIKEEYAEVRDWAMEKRQVIIKVLLERLEG